MPSSLPRLWPMFASGLANVGAFYWWLGGEELRRMICAPRDRSLALRVTANYVGSIVSDSRTMAERLLQATTAPTGSHGLSQAPMGSHGLLTSDLCDPQRAPEGAIAGGSAKL